MSENLKFIKEKRDEWLWYDAHQPKSDYDQNREEHDEFRRKHDRDCVLTEGNLYADTLFSLWTPLRFTLVRLNGYQVLNQIGSVNDKIGFLDKIRSDAVLEELLPPQHPLVQTLERLFELGMGRENVFLLPERRLNSARAGKPFYDYVPAFLLESFPGGTFSSSWKDEKEYKNWILEQKLGVFFDGTIAPEHIRDISGSKDLRSGIPPEGIDALKKMLEEEIIILEKRKAVL
ncbi:MAG: hypothetical protein ACI4HI_14710 [Lachnospiraceae bacterium]